MLSWLKMSAGSVLESGRQTNQLIKQSSSYDVEDVSFCFSEPEEEALCYTARWEPNSSTYSLKCSSAPRLIKRDRGQQHDHLTAS